MPARLLTTLSPVAAGFAPVALDKRELLGGTVVLLVARLGEIAAALPGAEARMRGLVLTLDERPAWRRLGPALWHLQVRRDDLPRLVALLAGIAEVAADGSAAAEHARSREIELARLRIDLAATRRDYHASVAHLTESEERFRALVETSRDWIWAMDADLVYTYSSPRVRNLLGHAPEDMLGRNYFDTMLPAEAARVRPLLAAAVRERRAIVNLENINLHRDGRQVVLETSAVPILGADGALVGYRGIDRDITERRSAEEERLLLERQVWHAQKLESLGVLAGGIAHDFNNLLVAVLGNAELALLEMPEHALGRDAVIDIRRAALRASELTNQMLAYSGKGRFVVEPVDLGALVQEMGQLLRVSISKRARLRYELAPGLPAVEVDAAQIRQIVMNLVTNASEAIEATDAAGAITLRTSLEQDGRSVALAVVDTGCGMTPDVKARLFDPFFTTKFQGRGLGLAAVQGIVRGHRGSLSIASEPGRGATITVLLPAGAAAGEPAAAPSYQPPCLWQGTGTVLVIDDDSAVRQFTRRILERLGFTSLCAEDGARGLEIFRAHAADIVLVVLDLTMPVMDGEQTFLELRRHDPDVPVVLASGYNEQDATSRFAGAGLAGFVKKPYTIEGLTAVVRSALAR